MIAVHFLDTDDHEFSAAERSLLEQLALSSEPEVRDLLPMLRSRLNLVVTTGTGVIPETGEVGYAASPDVVHWKVDASRGVAAVAAEHLRHMLFHELYHCARLIHLPGYRTEDWYDGSVVEGLATVFEREAGWRPPYGEYPPDEVANWAAELFRQPVDHTFNDWKFAHPDGRRWISYRVGAWLVEQAVARSGRGVADLVWEPTASIVRMAGVEYHPVASV